MNLLLYPLIATRDGRQLGEFPLGGLAWNGSEGVVLDCPDREVSQRLHRHFLSPLSVRRVLGTPTSVLTHEWRELAPGTEEHFQEALARLHRLGLAARPAGG